MYGPGYSCHHETYPIVNRKYSVPTVQRVPRQGSCIPFLTSLKAVGRIQTSSQVGTLKVAIDRNPSSSSGWYTLVLWITILDGVSPERASYFSTTSRTRSAA